VILFKLYPIVEHTYWLVKILKQVPGIQVSVHVFSSVMWILSMINQFAGYLTMLYQLPKQCNVTLYVKNAHFIHL